MRWLLGSLVLTAVSIWAAILALPDTNLHVIFCDVGQGDAILFSYDHTQLLIDGGPNSRVLTCLANHMPFYDKTLEAVIMTHPQADHFTGLLDVFAQYQVLAFIRSQAVNDTAGYKRLLDVSKEVPTSFVGVGNKVLVGEKLVVNIIWPPTEWKHQDLNTYSVGTHIAWKDVDFVLTGDADDQVDLAMVSMGLLKEVEILKVPHHGSKTAMSDLWIARLSPQLAVIQAGKNNRFGHPRPEPLSQLEKVGAKVLRNDIHGEIEIITDGFKWWYNLQYAD